MKSMLATVLCPSATFCPAQADDRPFVQVARDKKACVLDPSGKAFTPWGFTRPRWLHERLADVPPPADCPQAVVSGHTVVPAVEVRHGGRRILVDTFGGYGSVLSAVLLPEQTVVTSE